MDIEQQPGMKQGEFQKCAICHEGVANKGITFYRVRMERFILDPRAIQRQHGLEMMLGSPELAFHMGPQDDIAKRIDDPHVFLVCENCACMKEMTLALVSEELTRARDEGVE